MSSPSFADAVRAVLADTQNLPADLLDFMLQHQAQNGLPVAKTSGQRIVSGTRGTNVSTAGLTFAAGADVLGTALEFSATGNNDYIVRMFAPNWSNSVAGDGCQLLVNLDGGSAGGMGLYASTTAGAQAPCVGVGYITKPTTGEHSVNVRLVAVTGGTATIQAGAGSPLQAIVTLEVA